MTKQIATRDENRVPSLIGVDSIGFTDSTTVAVDASTHEMLTQSVQGLNINGYDYLSLAQNATQDIYTYKVGGAGGTTLATVTITYTDNTKQTLQTVVKS